MMLLPYFPLASGMLTGKYRAGEALPDDSRFAKHLASAQAARIIERDHDAVERLDGWATARGRSVAELAIAWLASQPVVASVIAGVSRPDQVDANARAAAWVLAPDEIVEVADVARGTSDDGVAR
jgi:aryl-alcohol dehydrogenase-like predicted oxidoreductase